jgi:DNA-binding winged helix-turn-helix (wHTH) protein
MADATFGPFSLDDAGTRLRRDDVEVKLRAQALRVLRVLVQHTGRTIGHEQMIAEAWDGTHVSRHTIDVTVSEVKKTLGEYGGWITHRSKAGYCLEIPSSDELIRRGWHFLNRRTREGAERAIDCFEEAASGCASDFRAFQGLSTCHLMLATFGMRPPHKVYPAFLDVHNHAVALGGLTPELRCNRGHGLHLFEQNLKQAETELLRVIDERPGSGVAYVRIALIYGALGRTDEALEYLTRGTQADPLLPTLPATVTHVRFWQRDYEAAVAVGSKAVELHPYLQITRVNYAQALQFSGRLDEALRQYQLASVMSPDLPWLRALEATCLARMNRAVEASTILEGLQTLRRTEFVDAYHMAVLHEALGQPQEALAELRRAQEENSAFLYTIRVDPKIDGLRDSAEFARICDERERSGNAAARPLVRRRPQRSV